jgi:hypothetical protein
MAITTENVKISNMANEYAWSIESIGFKNIGRVCIVI